VITISVEEEDPLFFLAVTATGLSLVLAAQWTCKEALYWEPAQWMQ
jgi:hypothetical protein